MPLPPPEQDWAEDLPLDALLCILHKLGTVELLIGGAAGVCRSWRRAAREEPELWRRIDMRDPSVPYFSPRVSLGIMVRQALRLSAGQCEVFSGGAGLDDDILLYLAEREDLSATSLKSLHLIRSYGLSKEVFAKAINKFPLLEELELSACYYDADLIELVARVCPRLKHFTYVDTRCHCHYPTSNDRVAFAIATMHELHSLHLFGDTLSNKGLAAILDNCPYMEYLNVPYCQNIKMDDVNLVEKCAGIYMDDYDYFLFLRPSFSDDDDDFSFILHSDFWDDYVFNSGDDVDDLELEEAERVLDNKSMRRYLS
ncbi:hypothetical protein BRADI_3g17590v3 [Brachypodium distachyon]|uniref:F-box domain-containing protein n=2 Tax=Brachypodium distachyon TaxID=15368 RepID=A0A0Q3LSR9_BRADI|nr:hypothetical protein BRADI_3g17590v3 [Brachypodium distachyon]